MAVWRLVDPELLPVVARARDERAVPGELPGAVEHRPLRFGPHRDHPRLAALGPARLEFEVIAAVGVTRLELDRLFAPQAEGLLQFETHAHMGIAHRLQIRRRQRPRLRDVGHELPLRDSVVVVGAGDDILPVDLLRPPADHAQPVLDGAC